MLKSQLEHLQQNYEALEEENARLIKQCNALEERLARQNVETEFVESHGALFKRLPGGGYEKSPYCRECRNAMWSFGGVFPFECGNPACRRQVGFSGQDVEAVISGLPE